MPRLPRVQVQLACLLQTFIGNFVGLLFAWIELVGFKVIGHNLRVALTGDEVLMMRPEDGRRFTVSLLLPREVTGGLGLEITNPSGTPIADFPSRK
ncbi:MAG TPA: hypothetical protein VH308_01005 [Terracidiphilus sp.]|nr:hypothetical protein [Terracidiphilus sp.]